MINNSLERHALIYNNGVLGFTGYTGEEKMFCVLANGDNNFLHYGIAENSLLIVDQGQPFEEDKLNVFMTDNLVNGQNQMKLSLTRLGEFLFIGRVIMSVSQYS